VVQILSPEAVRPSCERNRFAALALSSAVSSEWLDCRWLYRLTSNALYRAEVRSDRKRKVEKVSVDAITLDASLSCIA